MRDFTLAALPFGMIGICLALICANYNKQASAEEKNRSALRMSVGMCIGMCAGVAVSTAFDFDLALCISLGVLMGETMGLCFRGHDPS